MFGGVYFGGAPFGGAGRAPSVLQAAIGVGVSVAAQLTATAALAASPVVSVTMAATLTVQVDLVAAPRLSVTMAATLASPYAVDVTLGGVDIRHRVRRKQGIEIRDILNDAPNTCRLTVEGDPPLVGQRLRVQLGSGRVLFAGPLQQVAQRYDLKPNQRAWDLSAIDDTARANYRRPFGSWVETSATTIAQELTARFTPAMSPAGIAPGLPPVTITFDGSDTVISALARLATLIGGYAKVEDGTIYLFQTDVSDPPDPLDPAHPPLDDPHITIATDASQLRTRVYGKGYGETLRSDVLAGESLLPIEDGVQFPTAGGELMAGTTAEGAQSVKLAYSGVVLPAGGTLVGPGAAPGVAPLIALTGGAGVASGLHSVALVFVTANGRSLPSPVADLIVGQLAGPTTAPTAAPALPGVGVDEGTHDYLTTFVTSYGETNSGAVSNPVATTAISGQLPTPAGPTVAAALPGLGIDPGSVDYQLTFVNANGETLPSASTAPVRTDFVDGQIPAPPGTNVGAPWSGAGVPDGLYYYATTFVTATGETTPSPPSANVRAETPFNQIPVRLPMTNMPGVTGRKLYRALVGGSLGLVATISNLTTEDYLDTTPSTGAAPPATNTTGTPARRVPLSNIAIGPSGTTARRLYRRFNFAGTWKLVTTLTNNSETTYTDAKPNSQLGADAPTQNTSGAAVQRVPLSGIPIGPLGVTARKLYRRFNLAGGFYLVATIANNTATTYVDTTANSGRGPAYTGANSAIGNRIAVLAIPTGAAAVTARELYMSLAGGGTRRLALTLADNVTTSATIDIGDAALAGQPAEPTTDTSGLQQPPGQVNPGATVLPLAAASTFRLGGGWVVLGGGQVVRYTGIGQGQSLVGIPASGPGAITTTVLYGSQALPAPMLVGVVGVAQPLLKGSAVHIWVQRDDLQAQAEQRARAGGDGIVEYLIADARRGLESLTDRCDADLALFSRPIVTAEYATRDIRTRSGKPVRITLPGFTVPEPLVIQEVTITALDRAENLAPRFTVRASSVRFSLEDTLRRLIVVENKGIR